MNPSLTASLAKFNLAAPIRREFAVVPKILDEKAGLVRYTASDESLDCHGEIVRVKGWRFKFFAKNAPFINSHDYSDVRNLLGSVVAFGIEGAELVEDVKYAVTDAGNTLADWCFKMVRDQHLKAVSVGFVPTSMCSKWDGDTKDFLAQVADLKLDAATAARLRCVYREQEQIELSQCIIGANPNALAKSLRTVATAYKAGTLTEENVTQFAALIENMKHAEPAADSADADPASPRTRLAVLAALQTNL
jgi:hypothetical protein